MGLSMEFYAGSAADIGKAFTAMELEGLRDGSLAHAYADLSLHLSPDHLDILSEEVAASLGREPLLLLDSLEAHVGGTDGESSAEVVATRWVETMAATAAPSIAKLVESWMATVAEEVGDPSIVAGPDAVAAVKALVQLCREATRRKTQVVFAWYL
jgi:hypothetical protein